MFWLRNKQIIFLLHTPNLRPDNRSFTSPCILQHKIFVSPRDTCIAISQEFGRQSVHRSKLVHSIILYPLRFWIIMGKHKHV